MVAGLFRYAPSYLSRVGWGTFVSGQPNPTRLSSFYIMREKITSVLFDSLTFIFAIPLGILAGVFVAGYLYYSILKKFLQWLLP